MELLEYTNEPQLSTAEIIASVESLVGVRKFEYEPRIGFLHATVNKEHIRPYDLVKRIEDGGISADGLFLFYPESLLEKYTQHVRYIEESKEFRHSSGAEVDETKLKVAA